MDRRSARSRPAGSGGRAAGAEGEGEALGAGEALAAGLAAGAGLALGAGEGLAETSGDGVGEGACASTWPAPNASATGANATRARRNLRKFIRYSPIPADGAGEAPLSNTLTGISSPNRWVILPCGFCGLVSASAFAI